MGHRDLVLGNDASRVIYEEAGELTDEQIFTGPDHRASAARFFNEMEASDRLGEADLALLELTGKPAGERGAWDQEADSIEKLAELMPEAGRLAAEEFLAKAQMELERSRGERVLVGL